MKQRKGAERPASSVHWARGIAVPL